ncbi:MULTISPECIES: hypothetical protein [unclassified Streptomyces]|uniref:hypothetical protein n=1 Tax=unclassified Streptomyces TaxID=2593676 RepID=UPI00081DF67E|nr:MULTISPECIES: hypothetical protein [unclassified Streptomyces]SCE91178.1 hypothetical protein GA0115257_1041101 [Streptomyces sp. LcepLS]
MARDLTGSPDAPGDEPAGQSVSVGNDSTVYVNNTIYPSVDRRRPFRSATSRT